MDQNETALFELIFRASPAATILSVFDNGLCVDANEAYARLTEFPREELVGRTTLELGIWHVPEERRRIVTELLQHRRLSGVEITIRTKTGRLVRTMASGEIVRIGGRDHIISFFFDITDLKRAEEEMKNAMLIKDEFLANLSHEIRTPMTPIIGYAELLLESGLSGDQKAYIRTIRNSTINLLSLLNNLIDISKIEAGHVGVTNEPCSLKKIMNECRNLFREKAREKGLRIKIRTASGVDFIVADGQKLRQVLNNLLSNAVKYTRKGRIELSFETDGGRLLIRVADTGIGIPGRIKEMIFEKFIIGDSSVSRKYGGAGLGLPIARRLMQLMGGTLEVESREGEGSVFTAEMPFVPGERPGRRTTADSRARKLCAEIRKTWEELDAEISAYSGTIPFTCVLGCGRCCDTPSENIETSLLEMLPLAVRLSETGSAAGLLSREEELTGRNPCVFYEEDPAAGRTGCCTVYEYRPTICRLFGFSAGRDKHGKKRAILCAPIKKARPELESEITDRVAEGLHVPGMAEWARRVSLIDQSLGMEKHPINVALKKALEWLGAKQQWQARSTVKAD